MRFPFRLFLLILSASPAFADSSDSYEGVRKNACEFILSGGKFERAYGAEWMNRSVMRRYFRLYSPLHDPRKAWVTDDSGKQQKLSELVPPALLVLLKEAPKLLPYWEELSLFKNWHIDTTDAGEVAWVSRDYRTEDQKSSWVITVSAVSYRVPLVKLEFWPPEGLAFQEVHFRIHAASEAGQLISPDFKLGYSNGDSRHGGYVVYLPVNKAAFTALRVLRRLFENVDSPAPDLNSP
jgi:hypothetical protein